MNKKGTSTALIVLITAIVTMLLCYIFYKLWSFYMVNKTGDDMLTISESMFDSADKNQTSIVDKTSGEKTKLSNANANIAIQSKIIRLKKIIDENFLYEYDNEELVDSAASGLLAGLNDPYAVYYNESDFKSFYTQTEGEYRGIGVYVAFDKVRGLPIVLAPLENSPAEEAGVLPGDYIEYVEELYANENNYEQLIDTIKGKEGTKVKIGFIRINESKEEERIELNVERRNIEINPIKSEVYDKNIGYIKLSSFDETSYNGFKEKYDDLIQNKKVKGLIVDLRDNPGGILEICRQITDLIVPEGKIVYTVDKVGREETIYSKEDRIQIPLVVLVNENSASASEVFTGAVKDYGVGTIIGKKTYGKGVVQTLKSLGDGTYVKLTTQEYFSPSGNKIDGQGVTPDIEVDLPEGKKSYSVTFEEDTQLQRAIEEIKNKI